MSSVETVRITPDWHDGRWLMKVRDSEGLKIEYEVPPEHVEPLRDALDDVLDED